MTVDIRELIREHIATAESVHVRELSEGIAEWTPGHSLNDAMRVASKRLLCDLWREARRCHGFADEGGPTVITAYINQHTTA